MPSSRRDSGLIARLILSRRGVSVASEKRVPGRVGAGDSGGGTRGGVVAAGGAQGAVMCVSPRRQEGEKDSGQEGSQTTVQWPESVSDVTAEPPQATVTCPWSPCPLAAGLPLQPAQLWQLLGGRVGRPRLTPRHGVRDRTPVPVKVPCTLCAHAQLV